MTDMNSIVARAILVRRYSGYAGYGKYEPSEVEIEETLPEAKAAIEAMLLPMDYMMEAGLDAYGHNPDMPDEEVEQIWQVMVLAALGGKE